MCVERVLFLIIKRQFLTNLDIDTHLTNEQNTTESVIFKILPKKLVFFKQFVNEWFKIGSHHLLNKHLRMRYRSLKIDFTYLQKFSRASWLIFIAGKQMNLYFLSLIIVNQFFMRLS